MEQSAQKEFDDWLLDNWQRRYIPDDEEEIYRWHPILKEEYCATVKRIDNSHLNKQLMTETYEKFEELQKKLQWYEDAKRQIYVQDAKKEIQKKAVQARPDHMIALTIAPDEDNSKSIEAIQRIHQVLLNKCPEIFTTGSHAVFEQRSKGDEEPYGWHIHYNLVNQKEYPAVLQKRIRQFLMGKKINIPATVKTEFANPKWLAEYMSGTKKDRTPEVATLKALKVIKDKILRQEAGVQDLISF